MTQTQDASSSSSKHGPTMKAAAAQRDITPPVGLDIFQPPRQSVSVHDPLMLQVLLIEDRLGERIAIIRFDLLGMNLQQTEAWQETAKQQFGIDHLLMNSSHPHSVPYFGGRSGDETPHGHANAPFAHNMTLAYTNFGQGYIPDDASLALGANGGYEAGKLPLWWACGALSEWFGPPEVGAEAIIKKTIASLWD